MTDVDAGAATVDIMSCAVCGSSSWDTRFEEPPYAVRRCRSCELVWVSPRLDETSLTALYGAEYWRSDSPKTKGYADYRHDGPLYLKTFERRFRLVSRHARPGGSVLDIGCAAGYFMKVMRDRGFDVHGVELSADIAGYAVDELGLDVHVGTLDTSPYEAASFDLVTMWDVIEHVPDPRALLRTARQLIDPGGVLLLETQNIDSAFARLLGPKWHHFKHQEHLFHFNRTSMTALLRDAGFTVERITPWFAGKYVSLSFIAERSARLHPVLSKAFGPVARSDAALYINVLDEMVIVARPAVAAV